MNKKSIKPIEIKWSEWDAPNKLNGRHESLIQLSILGYPTALIAEKLGYSPEHVRKLLRSPNVAQRVMTEREQRFNSVLRERGFGIIWRYERRKLKMIKNKK